MASNKKETRQTTMGFLKREKTNGELVTKVDAYLPGPSSVTISVAKKIIQWIIQSYHKKNLKP